MHLDQGLVEGDGALMLGLARVLGLVRDLGL